MSVTDILKGQHSKLGTMLNDIEKLIINPDTVLASTSKIQDTLKKISSTLFVHLTMEDEHLYPKMISSNNPDAKSTAEAFKKEMGGLAQTFKTYSTYWTTGTKMGQEAKLFIQQTQNIISALRKRIQSEETKLYPLADKL